MSSLKYYFAVILFLISFRVHSQSSLYTPLNIQDAYENGTRSYDGKPGPNYWQNNADYRINAVITPQDRVLSGSENITYNNNSPDTLDRIVFRLYQNIEKLSSVHDFPFDETEPSKGMVLTALKINGENIDLKDEKQAQESGTNLIVKNIKTLPGASISVFTEWNFVIPKINEIRMGAYDSTTFFIAYWYPQIAVYDDIDGWDMINYTGQVEFYNDFNNFDVNITVPNNMCIWSTGILQNPTEVMSPALYERYKSAMESAAVVNVISKQDYLTHMPVFNNTNAVNTWHINAAYVPDFTFGLSNHYLWDGCSVNTGEKKVFVSAAYKEDTTDFYEVCETAAETVEYLSKTQPGVAFPFPKITVFDGSGGMESPMMVNESVGKQRIWQVYVTTHEVAHSFFPFYMGINERKYAWMDEGWAQFLDEPIQWQCDTTIDFHARDIFRYTNLAGQEAELPMMTLSYDMKGAAYGNASYFKPDAAYHTLKELLGDELFIKSLQEYIKRWNGKHPMPYDFFNTFNEASKQDLNWFWEPWFFETGYPDIGIDTVIVKDGKVKVSVQLLGKIPTSVQINFNFTDGSVKTGFKNCSVWRDNEENIAWFEESLDGKKLKSITLGNKYIPDVIKENDIWEF